MLARKAAVLVLFLVACGASARQKALGTGLLTLNAARDGFVAWDAAHQEAIVRDTPAATVAQAIADYRKKRQDVLYGFQLAYGALVLAATEFTPASLTEAALQAKQLYELIKALKE